LLVVIAIIAILAAMLLPSLGKSKTAAQGIQCLNNTHQMGIAWHMYCDDNREYVPPSYDGGAGHSWVEGNLDFTGANRSNWDINQDIVKSLLWKYCGQSAGIWKCPGDPSTVVFQGVTYPRVRSISMDAWFNSTDVSGFGPARTKIYKKLSDLLTPGPSSTWLFLDERYDSINDGEFCVGMFGYPDQPGQWTMVDYPASYHNGACGFAFSDGHSELHKWLDPRTAPPLSTTRDVSYNTVMANSPDIYWLMDHTTRTAE
jgi:prepilin-type processing-associated H-X9-DG protein